MNNSLLTILIFFAIAATSVLFFYHYGDIFRAMGNQKWTKEGFVKGSAVCQNGQFFTLNLEQQKEILSYINQLKKENKKPIKGSFSIEKLLIYLFDHQPTLEFSIIGEDDMGNLYLNYKNEIYKDQSIGKLKQKLLEAV